MFYTEPEHENALASFPLLYAMKTLLIVEDEPLHLEKVKEAFRGYENQYHILTTNTLTKAKQLMHHNRPDIVLIDNHLPDGQGKEILRYGNTQCPIILMTAYGDEDLAVDAMKDGALDYMVKLPENISGLPGMINQSLRQWELITEQKQLKRELEKREKKYRSLFEESNDAIFIYNGQGQILDVNLRAIHLLGYEKKQLLEQNIRCLHPASELPRIEQNIKKTMQRGHYRFESSLKTKAGKTIYVEISARIFDPEEKLIQGIVRDITQWKETLEKLTEQKEKYEKLVENAIAGIGMVDLEEKLIFTNDTFARILGYSKDELQGMNLSQLSTNQNFNNFKAETTKRKNNVSSIYETMLHKKDGSNIHLLVYGSPFRDIHNRVIGTIGVIIDITERKEAEIKLRELNAMKNRLFSIIGHDLRTPVSEIMGFTELLIKYKHHYSREKMNNFHEHVYHSATTLNGLLENLLLWSGLQRNSNSLNPEAFYLNDLLDRTIDMFHSKANTNNIQIESHIPESIMVFADNQLIRTVFRNLLSNALKYTPKNGKITINARYSLDKCIVEIADNGVGMRHEKQQKLFSFEGGESSRGLSGEKGTGIGLILCKELLDKHGEKIWVQSHPGQGSRFFFTLPLKNTVSEES
jgi:PAS domain S-box-containing protein